MHVTTLCRAFLSVPALAGLACLLGSFRSSAVCAESPPLEVLSRQVVCNYPDTDPYDPANRFGFNHAPSVVLLPNGDLLCAWFSGPFEAAVNQVILASRSTDQGQSWNKAEILANFPHKSNFDPAFIADGERTWFFFSAGRWNRYPFVHDERAGGIGPASYHTYHRQSTDNGRTWSEPAPFRGTFFCRSNGIKLSSGELLLPVYTLTKQGEEDEAMVCRSVDGGKSWALGRGVKCPGGNDEPTIAEVSGGNVLMVLRTRDGFLWRTYSQDKGESWPAPQKDQLDAAAASANLFRLADGRILLTHGPCKPPQRTLLTMRVSADDGRSWSTPLTIAEVKGEATDRGQGDRQVTYPSVTQLRDGTVLVVWADLGLSDTRQYGNIQSARIRVAPVAYR